MTTTIARSDAQHDTDLSSLRFVTEDGDEVSPGDWHGSPVILVFLRWLG